MKEERFPCTGKPLRGRRLRVAEGGASEPRRRVQPQGCGGQSGETLAQRLGAEQHSPAQEACLLTCRGRRGLGAKARASVGSQGEDWGWRREHSLKGLVHHSSPGGSPGKSLQLPKRQETFSSLFVSWCARRGDSEHRLNELQRRARATAISADPTATMGHRGKSGEIPAQRLGAEQHSPAREVCLLTRLGVLGLGAEAWASVGLHGEDWGWRREHSLKGLAHHSWLGGSPGKSLQLPKRKGTFSSLFVSRCARRGDSERRLNELQRRA